MLRKTMNRALSVILAVLMLAVSMPVAFATEPVSLTADNVTTWPIANGEIWFGQKVSDGITIAGGEVRYDINGDNTLSDDEIIPGRFDFVNPDYYPDDAYEADRASIKFIPDDEQSYTGFSVTRSKNVTYVVKAVTPVLIDENNPPIASAVEPGARLSTSQITGGQMKNPYNEAESNVADTEWSWTSRRTVINQSGYYEAEFAAPGYEIVTRMIYVRIAGEIPETTITEKPSVSELTYDGITTWGDVELKGGKAALKIEGDEVEGTFAVTDFWKTRVVNVGSYEIDVVFTPADPEAALPYSFKIPVTVNKGTVKFVDETGAEIVPEITLPYGFKVGDDLNGYLKEYLNISASFNYTETEGYGELIVPGTHEYEVKVSVNNSNFEGGTLKFKVIVNQLELELKVKNVVGGKQIYIEGGDIYHLNGDFDVKYFIDGKEAGTIEGVKFNETFAVKQDKSGVYTYEIVYNEAENDPYKVTKVTAVADDIKLQHSVKVVGQEAVTYKYGDTVTINAPAHEKPYYEFTGWVNESGITLTDEQRSAESISTTMPDNDIELEATYKFNFSLFIKYIFEVICSWFAKIAAFITGAFAA